MEAEEFARAFGKLVEVKSNEWGSHLFFIPNKLPPKIDFNRRLVLALSKADSTISKLSGAGLLLPNPDLLVSPYMRKEALSSSRIEGTRISLPDYFLAEAKGEEDKDPEASEVINYIRAMNYALKEIEDKPIDLKLLKNMHARLMDQARGRDKMPGKFRSLQNWIGPRGSKPQEASFVPPPPEKVSRLMRDLVDYMNSYDEMPLLIRAALIHYQFETIHPFCDGNGRIGRALVVLYLCKKNVMLKPLLYLSGYFEKYRSEYNQLLAQTNKSGRFEDWILFFLDAVKTQSEDALEKAVKLQKLKENYREKVQAESQSAVMLKCVDNLFVNPYVQISGLAKKTGTSYPTAKKIVEMLVRLGLLEQLDNSGRNKTFVAHEVLEAIS